MSKPHIERRLDDAEASAFLRALRTSPRKLNLVAQAWVGKDLVMKRFCPRARGRAGRIEKPFSNITIVVREVADEAAA